MNENPYRPPAQPPQPDVSRAALRARLWGVLLLMTGAVVGCVVAALAVNLADKTFRASNLVLGQAIASAIWVLLSAVLIRLGWRRLTRKSKSKARDAGRSEPSTE
jgi:uncharacterized membrane protein YcjF (UPF0283 family)